MDENSLKEDIFNYIKENNGRLDLVDITLKFKEFPANIVGLAVHELQDEVRIDRLKYPTGCVYAVRNF